MIFLKTYLDNKSLHISSFDYVGIANVFCVISFGSRCLLFLLLLIYLVDWSEVTVAKLDLAYLSVYYSVRV